MHYIMCIVKNVKQFLYIRDTFYKDDSIYYCMWNPVIDFSVYETILNYASTSEYTLIVLDELLTPRISRYRYWKRIKNVNYYYTLKIIKIPDNTIIEN